MTAAATKYRFRAYFDQSMYDGHTINMTVPIGHYRMMVDGGRETVMLLTSRHTGETRTFRLFAGHTDGDLQFCCPDVNADLMIKRAYD